MFNRTIPVLLLSLTALGPLTTRGVDQETFGARITNTADINEAAFELEKAIVGVLGDNKALNRVVLFSYLAQLDPIWDAKNQLRKNVLNQFVARTKTFTRESLLAWQGALEKVTSKASLTGVLTFLIHQEGLFEASALKTERAAQLLARLQSLPPKAVADWAEASRSDLAGAAMDLIGREVVFKKEKLDEDAFGKLVEDAKVKAKK